jgi:opacity protein-like surface antigen
MRKLAMAAMVAAAFMGSSYAQDAAPPTSTYFENVKITVNARARADGFMRVRVLPENGAPREATFGITRRMNENDLAKNIAVSLNAVLAPEYVADKDNGEHVKIEKKQKDAANFSVEITFNVPGFAVILDN